ncbi:MAG TPA: hypothetical protein VF401_00945 [Candidatus Saccharimonadales bacterium]
MTLTREDLLAIKDIFERGLEEGLEDVKRQTAAGFAEVHARIDALQATVDRIERVQQAEIQRNDHQDIAITRIRKSLHAA